MSYRASAFADISAEFRVIGRRLKHLVAETASAVHPQLQAASYQVLVFLAENGPTRGSSLACQFHVDKGVISRQVQHLVELGLAERAADPGDGRAQLVSASPRAVRLIEEAGAARQRCLEERLADWSDAELAGLAARLGRFNADLRRI